MFQSDVSVFSVLAATTELSSVDELRAREAQAPKDAEPITDPRIPTGEDKEEMEEFIKERLKTVVITKLDENEDLNNLKSIDVQHSAEYINMLKESKKSTFEKIYDNAMKRLSGPEGRTPEDINEPYDDVYYYINDQPSVEEQKKEWAAPDFPVVNVELPNGTQTLVPAKEHIPYLFSKIEILPTGLIGINETITVIANGDKLKNGLSRAIPKYSTSRAGIRNKIDLTLLSVTVNGQEVPYKAEEAGDKIILTPKEEYTLAPGIYTYNFAYLLDRQLWYYDTFNEFYWDVTGSSWNLVVANAGASVSLPGTQPPLSQNILLGYPGQLTTDGAFIAKGEDNTLGFAAQTPCLSAKACTLSYRCRKPICCRQIWASVFHGLLPITATFFLPWPGWLQFWFPTLFPGNTSAPGGPNSKPACAVPRRCCVI